MGHGNIPSLDNGEVHSLSERINIATRTMHTQLNRLIISRLPLALPPYTTDPSLYLSILLNITPIYTTFESIWDDISNSPDSAKQIQTVLSAVQLPGLARSQVLLGDISEISGLIPQEIELRLQDVSRKSPKLLMFLNHIRKAAPKKPHILLAYTWILYMALFSGGRYIRATLKNAGKDFWIQSLTSRDLLLPEKQNLTPESNEKNGKKCLGFFNFPGQEDGEDIKREFKRRFNEVEKELDTRQKEDIVKEAQRIFLFLLEMMGELDQACGPLKVDVKQTNNTGDRVLLGRRRRLHKFPLRLVFASKPDRRTYVVVSVVCCATLFMVWYGLMVIKLRSLI
jgi:heme oxygenase